MITEIYNVTESHVNKTKNYIIGKNKLPVGESVIHNLKDLYKYGIKNYGKCISKIYTDSKTYGTIHNGYVFEKLKQYEDVKETYLHEVWLTIDHYKETITREYLPVN